MRRCDSRGSTMLLVLGLLQGCAGEKQSRPATTTNPVPILRSLAADGNGQNAPDPMGCPTSTAYRALPPVAQPVSSTARIVQTSSVSGAVVVPKVPLTCLDPEDFADIGILAFQKGDLTTAERCLRATLEIDPKHQRALIFLSRTLNQQQIEASASRSAPGMAVDPASLSAVSQPDLASGNDSGLPLRYEHADQVMLRKVDTALPMQMKPQLPQAFFDPPPPSPAKDNLRATPANRFHTVSQQNLANGSVPVPPAGGNDSGLPLQCEHADKVTVRSVATVLPVLKKPPMSEVSVDPPSSRPAANLRTTPVVEAKAFPVPQENGQLLPSIRQELLPEIGYGEDDKRWVALPPIDRTIEADETEPSRVVNQGDPHTAPIIQTGLYEPSTPSVARSPVHEASGVIRASATIAVVDVSPHASVMDSTEKKDLRLSLPTNAQALRDNSSSTSAPRVLPVKLLPPAEAP